MVEIITNFQMTMDSSAIQIRLAEIVHYRLSSIRTYFYRVNSEWKADAVCIVTVIVDFRATLSGMDSRE
jgi:hypothetical protein